MDRRTVANIDSLSALPGGLHGYEADSINDSAIDFRGVSSSMRLPRDSSDSGVSAEIPDGSDVGDQRSAPFESKVATRPRTRQLRVATRRYNHPLANPNCRGTLAT